MFPSVTPPVVDQIIRSLELLPTEVAGVTELSLVDQLMLLERMFQFERHPTVFTSEVPHVGVDLEMDMIGRDLVEGLATLFTAPTVATDAV